MPKPKDKFDGPDHTLLDSAKVSLEEVKENFNTFIDDFANVLSENVLENTMEEEYN